MANTSAYPLQWRHNGFDGVSNHQPHHCLLSRLFWRRSKKTPKLRVTGLCAGYSPGTGEFPVQLASYAENVPVRWRHHAYHRRRVCFHHWSMAEIKHNGPLITKYGRQSCLPVVNDLDFWNVRRFHLCDRKHCQFVMRIRILASITICWCYLKPREFTI